MSSQKILVVFGATGNQGGSVINSILSDPVTAKGWKIRGITRDPSKPNAKALEARGVETVAADINSKEQIKKALEGAYAVFAVTNYWEKMDADLEIQQGKNVADAAKESGIQHLIWSSLLNITELTKGAFKGVEHFDSKATVEAYIRTIGIPATFFMPGFFMSNIPGSMLRPHPPNNIWTLTFPDKSDTPIPLFDAGSDTGKFVKGILTHRDKVLGERVYAATDYYTLDDVLKVFKEVKPGVGKDAVFKRITEEEFKEGLKAVGLPQKGADELYENFTFMHDWGYYGKAGLEGSHAILDEKPTSLGDFFRQSKALEGVN